MKSYYEHLLKYPHTLVARILGLHKVKINRDGKIQRIYLVIMANVFNTTRQIEVKYDLKGSTQGRTSCGKNGEKPPAAVAMKDCDWIQQKMKVNLTEAHYNLMSQ